MHKARLVLADDHPLILEGIRRVLEPEFEVVGVAVNGRQAVALAEQYNPDAVVLDIGMPELNGIEAARQIRREIPEVKIVFLTQVDDRAYARAAFEAEASAYVVKQSVVDELAAAIRAALAGRFYVSESLRQRFQDDRAAAGRSPETLFGRGLTPRQREVLQLVAEGKTGKEIASSLGISVKTVEFHKSAIMQELGMHSTAEVTRYAIEHGIARK